MEKWLEKRKGWGRCSGSKVGIRCRDKQYRGAEDGVMGEASGWKRKLREGKLMDDK